MSTMVTILHTLHYSLKNKLLTVIVAIVAGAVDSPVWKDLEIPVLDVHLNLARGARDVRQIGAPFTANCPVVGESLFGPRGSCTASR